MAFTGTLGQALINTTLPKEYRVEGTVTKKNLANKLIDYARKKPEEYAKNISEIKRIGDEFATFEGVSVGLDDIAPEYSKRNPILARAKRDFWRAKKEEDRVKVLIDTQSQINKITSNHAGDMGLIARSGGRGGTNQLMKAVSSPVAAADSNGRAVPYLIERGYSEGLSPAEAWITGQESRQGVITGQLGTADPGDLGKLLGSMMSQQVVTSPNCGTKNGISYDAKDTDIIGRYLAGSNKLVTPEVYKGLRKKGKSVMVRSSMTCEHGSGVCQKCRGQEADGSDADIGVNVGLRSAQALAEPLTQMALSARHGTFIAKEEVTIPGIRAVRQYIEVPKSFFGKATLANAAGKVSAINKAPQGGFEVMVGNTSHYVPPDKRVRVKKNQFLEAGDALSSGLPAPNEVVAHKGLGEGRKYMVNALSKVYSDEGIALDKRHLELMVKSQLNNVKITKEIPGYLPGDIVPYHEAAKAVSGMAKTSPVRSSFGKTLASPTLHHLPGAVVTKSMQRDFSSAGIGKVKVLDEAPRFEAHMSSASRTPLLNPNWMQRLGHRYQKNTLLDAAQYGQKANIHGHDPIPAIVFGKELRKGPGGTY